MTQDAVHIQLAFNWQPLGQVRLDREGRLRFPTAPRRPGLYRFRLRGSGRCRCYVGETDELRRRFQQYRTPGDTQRTNIRMNTEFCDHMTAGGTIEIDIAVDGVDVAAGAKPVAVDLAGTAMRRLLEHAALVNEAAAGASLLNR